MIKGNETKVKAPTQNAGSKPLQEGYSPQKKLFGEPINFTRRHCVQADLNDSQQPRTRDSISEEVYFARCITFFASLDDLVVFLYDGKHLYAKSKNSFKMVHSERQFLQSLRGVSTGKFR